MEAIGEVPELAPVGIQRDPHDMVDAATLMDTGITQDPTDVDIKSTTAQEHIDMIGPDQNPWTNVPRGIGREMDFDNERMEGVLVNIPGERSVSALSRPDDISVEDASLRDYGSVSSTNFAFGASDSQQLSPNPSAAVLSSQACSPTSTAQSSESESETRGVLEREAVFSAQDVEKIGSDPDWNMTPPTATAQATFHVEDPFSNSSFTHPALVPTPMLTREVSPTALLLMLEPGRYSGELSEEDIFRIQQLAEVFECARSYEDAYQLRRMVFTQPTRAPHRAVRRTVSDRALVNVLRNANNTAAYKEAAAFVKQEWRGKPGPVAEKSITGCLQQSYLGSMFRARTDLRYAEQHCRRAFDGMLALFVDYAPLNSDSSAGLICSEPSKDFIAAWLVVITSLVLTWEDPKFGSDDAWARLGALCPFGLSLPQVREQWRFRQVVGWCLNTLTEDGFWKMLLPVTQDLWLLAPSEVDLGDAESTLLFFYLFSQMQSGQFAARISTLESVQSQASCVLEFAQVWGLSAPEALSIVANYIVVENRPQELGAKSTLARRASMTTMALFDSLEAKGGITMDEGLIFMSSYASIRRQKENRFSTENYSRLVRSVVRDIVERNFKLELEVSALRDPRLRVRLSQASMTPSFSPTMLSTPRSSWSGYRSFKSIGRRASKIWTNDNNSNNDVVSLLSSRRWSRASSTKSAGTLESAVPSDRDVIMEDDDPA